jgi:hypothetical protein
MRFVLNAAIAYHDDGTATVTKISMLTGKLHSLTVRMTEEQYNTWWKGRALIQNTLPDTTADEREFLMTGITSEEWDTEFTKEEDK